MQGWTPFGGYFVAPLYDQVLHPLWEFVHCLYEIVVHPTQEAVGEAIESVVIGVPEDGTFFQFCQEMCTLERTSAQLLVSQNLFLTVVFLITLPLRPGALPLILSVTRAPLPSPSPTAPLLLAAQLLLPSSLCWQWDPVGQMKFWH